jgi:hypothetical protein
MRNRRWLVTLVLGISSFAVAQQAQSPQAAAVPQSNVKERVHAPTYSDINCAGFVTRESFNKAHHVMGGDASPHVSKFGQRDSVFLSGGGYQEGAEYRIVRQIEDPNKNEVFPGQLGLLKRVGKQYADIALVRVYFVENDTAVAEVTFACQPPVPGDVAIPSQERAAITYPKRPQFKRFVHSSGATTGKIIQANEFDYFVGAGQKVYLDLGSDQLKPGDYVRITRSYDSKEMPPVDRLVFDASTYEDTQKDAPKVGYGEQKNFPHKGLGEAMVISANANSATAIITLSLEDIHVGDSVEVAR